MTKYRPGDTEACVRQNRAYCRLLDDPETSPETHVRVLTAMVANYRLLDEHLSAGHPLPAVWERRLSDDLTGSEEPEAPGGAGDGPVQTEEEEGSCQ